MLLNWNRLFIQRLKAIGLHEKNNVDVTIEDNVIVVCHYPCGSHGYSRVHWLLITQLICSKNARNVDHSPYVRLIQHHTKKLSIFEANILFPRRALRPWKQGGIPRLPYRSEGKESNLTYSEIIRQRWSSADQDLKRIHYSADVIQKRLAILFLFTSCMKNIIPYTSSFFMALLRHFALFEKQNGRATLDSFNNGHR